MQLEVLVPWFQNTSLAEDGIVVAQHGRFGLGTVLIVEYQQSRTLLEGVSELLICYSLWVAE
jgi:hypothetical protein